MADRTNPEMQDTVEKLDSFGILNDAELMGDDSIFDLAEGGLGMEELNDAFETGLETIGEDALIGPDSTSDASSYQGATIPGTGNSDVEETSDKGAFDDGDEEYWDEENNNEQWDEATDSSDYDEDEDRRYWDQEDGRSDTEDQMEAAAKLVSDSVGETPIIKAPNLGHVPFMSEMDMEFDVNNYNDDRDGHYSNDSYYDSSDEYTDNSNELQKKPFAQLQASSRAAAQSQESQTRNWD